MFNNMPALLEERTQIEAELSAAKLTQTTAAYHVAHAMYERDAAKSRPEYQIKDAALAAASASFNWATKNLAELMKFEQRVNERIAMVTPS